MLMTVLPLLKIAVVFLAIVLGMRGRLGIGGSVLAGSFLLVVLFGHGPFVWVGAAGNAFVDPKTIFLAVIVALIMVLSSLMEKTGRTGHLLDGLSGVITNPRLRPGVFSGPDRPFTHARWSHFFRTAHRKNRTGRGGRSNGQNPA